MNGIEQKFCPWYKDKKVMWIQYAIYYQVI